MPSSRTVRTTPRSASGSRVTMTWRALRVAHDVGEALLGDAVDDQLLLGGQREVAGEPSLDLERRLARRPSCTAPAARSGARARRAPRDAAGGRSAAPPPPPRARPRGARRRLRAAPRERAARASRHAGSARSGVWPISSCSSRAMRRRSASWAARARRPLSRRSPSRRSSISLNASASATTSSSPVVASIRWPGASGSIWCMTSVKVSQRRQRVAGGRRGRSPASRRTRPGAPPARRAPSAPTP